MLLFVGFVLGAAVVACVFAGFVYTTRDKSYSGVLAIDEDGAMFLELDEDLESVKAHKLIFLRVVTIESR